MTEMLQHKRLLQILFFCGSILAFSSCHFKNKHASLVIHNAVIYTMDHDFSTHQAIAIENGKILAVGPEREILNEYNADQSIDAGGKFIYPGFIDAHCHFLAYGRFLREVNLEGTKSFEEVVQRVVEYSKTSSSAWIKGRGWDQNDWENTNFPDRNMLDSLFPDRPVVLRRIDGHALLANEAALKAAGIDLSTAVSGGEIQSNNGRLTGILIDKAMDLMDAAIPEPTEEEDRQALLDAQKNCFAAGLTTVDEAGLDDNDIRLIRKLQEEGLLKMRIYAMLSDDSTNYDIYLKRGIEIGDLLTIRAFKLYADGALGSRGACLLQPYEDLLPADKKGFLLEDPGHYLRRAYDLRKAGFQMCTHAIGDSANRLMLDIYAQVVADLPDHRWRIEHAQVVHEDDIAKFGFYHILPSVQPTHATSDMPWAPLRLGRNRMMRAYAYNSLKKENGMLALGTDFPIEGISPIETFYAAVFRKDKNGEPSNGFQIDDALTREEALRGMTIWNAIANFEEEKKGSLEPGKMADIIMLDQDLMKCPEEKIRETRVLMTIVNGEIVWKN